MIRPNRKVELFLNDFVRLDRIAEENDTRDESEEFEEAFTVYLVKETFVFKAASRRLSKISETVTGFLLFHFEDYSFRHEIIVLQKFVRHLILLKDET